MGLDYQFIKRAGALHIEEDGPAAAAADLNPPRAVLELVPESVAREHQILPLSLDGETLTCAAVNPDNLLVQDQLSFILNKRVRLVPASPWAIRVAINRHYGQSETESADSMLTEFTDTGISFEDPNGRAKSRGRLLGRRLPEVGRALAKTVTEHKRAIRGWDGEPADESIASLTANLQTADTRYPGLDPTGRMGKNGMFHYVVEEGQRALMVRPDGRIDMIIGPERVWRGRNEFRPMKHFVAHPGEFLIVRYRDGRQEHRPGPAEVWFDPRMHLSITREDALQVAAREAVVVYSQSAENEPVGRRIVYGPTLFVPAPGEWLHTFTWHGADGGSEGARKVAKGLVFQKLWLMPDQMYHDVTDVRTADDAVLTLRLMIFFELLDIERMLDTTHDPIGDFINAATSDVVDFTGRHSFESFKQNTSHLNDLDTYRQLTSRAAQCGYRINKVVYRGYGAPDRL
jgi:MshEN domain